MCDQRFKNGRGGTHRTQRPTDRQAKRSTGDTDEREDAKVQRAGNDQHTGRQTTTPQEESQANGGTNAEPGAKPPETVRRRATEEGGQQRDLGRRGGRGTASTRGRRGSLNRSRNDRRLAPQQSRSNGADGTGHLSGAGRGVNKPVAVMAVEGGQVGQMAVVKPHVEGRRQRRLLRASTLCHTLARDRGGRVEVQGERVTWGQRV